MTDLELEKLFKDKHRSKIASTSGRKDKQGNNIEMRLTLDEFTKLYKDANALPMFPYVISRVDDLGHYEVGNVFISTNHKNSLDAHGLDNELENQITKYCHIRKYNRRTVRRALRVGTLSADELLKLEPIRIA